MAWTIVGIVEVSAGSNTTCAFVLPGTVQNDDIALSGIYIEANRTITPPAGQGYAAADPQDAEGADFWFQTFWTVLQAADASTTHSFALGSPGVWRHGVMVIARPGDITTQPDTNAPAANVTTTNAATINTPADTATMVGDLACWFVASFNNNGKTWPATNDGNTVTERSDQTTNLALATAEYSGTTVSAMTETLASAAVDKCLAKTILLRPSGGGGAADPFPVGYRVRQPPNRQTLFAR